MPVFMENMFLWTCFMIFERKNIGAMPSKHIQTAQAAVRSALGQPELPGKVNIEKSYGTWMKMAHL